MGKFKVGDKVEITKAHRKFEKGDVLEVTEIDEPDSLLSYYLQNEDNKDWACEGFLKLVDSKPSKKQRIETLEKEVSELKLIVHELRERKVTTVELDGKGVSAASIIGMTIEPSTDDVIEFEGAQYRKVDRKAREGDVVILTKKCGNNGIHAYDTPYKVVLDGWNQRCINNPSEALVYNSDFKRTPETVDVYEPITEPSTTTTVEDEPKSPNQLRAEVIEKAKVFLETSKSEWEGLVLTDSLKGQRHKFTDVYQVYLNRISFTEVRVAACDVEFVVNEGKRTIVALMRGIENKKVYERGIAKCDPNDVFNEHIGKAIALGRALKLDVSEFEQAVQPTNYAIGQIGINETLGGKYPFEIIEIGKGDVFRKQFEPFTTSYGDTIHPLGFEDETTKALLIINDTNAIYETAVNK